GICPPDAGLGQARRTSTPQEREGRWKLKLWQLNPPKRKGKKSGRAAYSKKLAAPASGGFAILTRRVVSGVRRREQREWRLIYIASARRKLCKGRSCRRDCGVRRSRSLK